MAVALAQFTIRLISPALLLNEKAGKMTEFSDSSFEETPFYRNNSLRRSHSAFAASY